MTRLHAHLVDGAHVEHFEILLVHEAPLAGIDAANADLAHPLRADRRGHSADLQQLPRAEAAQAGHRHAVQAAARRQFAGVEIGVRIQPQHPQGLARSRQWRATAEMEPMLKE